MYLGLLVLGLVVWLILFSLGLLGYSGSKLVYTLFSIVTGTMLVTGFWQVTSYGYFFLTVFLWLGFWLKLTIHAILNYPFIEAVGSFVGDPGAWDEVTYAATIACVGVIFGKVLFNLIKSKSPIGSKRGETKPTVPPWYAKVRKWLWAALMTTAAAVVLVNMVYGVHLVGLAPRTILFWPMNALIAWLLNIGLATGISVLLWWDIVLKKNITVTIYAVIFEALFSSVFILSRAAYVFHAIPQLWAVYRVKKTLIGWSRAKYLFIAVTLILLLVVSISAVSTLRNYFYQSGAYSSTASQVAYARKEVILGEINELQGKTKISPPAEGAALLARQRELLAAIPILDASLAESKASMNEAIKSGSAQSRVLLNEFGYQIIGGSSMVILQLSVDRWIGLEGLMAVQSYPGKNMDLLSHALTEKPEAGKSDIYQTISKSIYLQSDGKKFRFATLPGAAAFLYYSNSLFIVMLGMTIFSMVILLAEITISTLTANPILCSLYGVVLASTVAQFGVAPRMSLSYSLMLAIGIFLVWIVQSKFFVKILCKFKFLNNAPM
jgi:hypothetical protein